jgi:hypothetical protein
MQAVVTEKQGWELEIDNENWRNWDDLFEELALFRPALIF